MTRQDQDQMPIFLTLPIRCSVASLPHPFATQIVLQSAPRPTWPTQSQKIRVKRERKSNNESEQKAEQKRKQHWQKSIFNLKFRWPTYRPRPPSNLPPTN